MIKELQLRLLPEQAACEQTLKQAVASETGFETGSVNAVRILKRSVDARQRIVYVNLKVRAFILEEPEGEEYSAVAYPDVSSGEPVIVVGAGPGGLFAALRLIELGRRPIVLERGKNVHERKRDVALLCRQHIVNSESNYNFGEGGAGAFSDGKLYTRSKKRGSVEKILNVLCQHGASTAILSDAHPHIGSDKLPRVIENIRKQIIGSGGEVRFNTRMDAFIIDNNRLAGVTAQTGETFLGPVILATGHSARDVYRYLYARKIPLQAKGIAAGLRLEHPQELIDRMRYRRGEGRGEYLPAAEYSFVTQVGGRGVYSFCMCPGGFIIPSATEQRQVVVNGMSPSNRGSQWANSGMVVEIHPEDVPKFASANELAMMAFQEHLEEQAWLHGGMNQTAPAQRMDDFVRSLNSSSLNSSSYNPGIVASPLHTWLPPFITSRLTEAFLAFERNSRGFITNEAQLLGVETRTSSPVRIPRDPATLRHITIEGLYPCGEGAGYAGGIVSAAIDGERCAEATLIS